MLKVVFIALLALIAWGCTGDPLKEAIDEVSRKPEPQWPDTDPPDEGGMVGYAQGITQYRKREVLPGKWQWVVDEEATKVRTAEDAHRSVLWFALRTRALTDKEMLEVLRYGERLNIGYEPYYKDEKSRELDRAYMQQSILQRLAKHANRK